ncbi:MBL fold metallo-hydrolase [Bacillus cytotoxicus]|uniref:MBL fold metallo-hydrolase n=1 Tax=Bacillus cereus group TaxID=86661 RepID=UPI001F5A032C|nr:MULTISPECIES: MBL fold metallo-hydrolase [Bacillus cereus group]MDH2888629.1 MBL fold metallo-hydrolase [Bacillus cytotoxicus]
MTRLIKETDFFTLNFLCDGVYAAISKPGQGAWSNAGVVDLGDELLVFDSFTTPSAGYELRRQAEDITGKKIKYLINSHFHGDHVFGNQAFTDATIISTSTTKKLCKEKNEIGDLEKEIEEMESYLDSLRNQIEENQDIIIKDSLTNQFNEMSKVLDDLPRMKIVLPSVIFEEKLIIEGSKRSVELYCLGGGHTPSDTFMYLPKEKIAFMGDLVTEELHLPIYNPKEFSSILEKVEEMDIETFVPGHGNVGNKGLLYTLSEYLTFLTEKSREALKNNQSLETFISKFDTPNKYKEWTGVNGIKGNLSKVYTFYKG